MERQKPLSLSDATYEVDQLWMDFLDVFAADLTQHSRNFRYQNTSSHTGHYSPRYKLIAHQTQLRLRSHIYGITMTLKRQDCHPQLSDLQLMYPCNEISEERRKPRPHAIPRNPIFSMTHRRAGFCLRNKFPSIATRLYDYSPSFFSSVEIEYSSNCQFMEDFLLS